MLTARDVRVGKDILELVSTAMYVDPLTAYREYLQNAADSIDEARRLGVLSPGDVGRVEIALDQGSRTVQIRDNGAAIPANEIVDRLLALGGSSKRGTEARGFRGVGRLAALGYAQCLTFRTRAQGEDVVTEVTWDGRKLRSHLADTRADDVAAVIAACVDVRSFTPDDMPDRFFEVEIGQIARQRGDRLLNTEAVEAYLAQVAPVPFSSEFRHAGTITEALRAAGQVSELHVVLNGGASITRPHRDEISLGSTTTEIHQLTVIELPGVDGGLAAVAWFGHHDYKGAIPASALVKGVRVRVGNIQIGDHTILEQIFPETRFNSWAVGEVHILDRRIVPNGRRDEFEANAHHANLVNHLSPIGRDIARRCRSSSTARTKMREFELAKSEAEQRLAILEQGAVANGARAAELARVHQTLARMEKTLDGDALDDTLKANMAIAVAALEEQLERAGESVPVDPLDGVPQEKRDAYREVFNLIYECSNNRAAAKTLVDRILHRILR
jgi:molecular chaperone HtpG